MSGVHEVAEKIEHASHPPSAHRGSASGILIGVTMAVLGVMLAISSAMVGAQRTELIETMILQSNKLGLYQSETMKFRTVEANLELLKSISPKPDEIQKVEATLRSKRGASGRADREDTAELKDLIASSTEDMADLLTPDPEEIVRFRKLTRTYERDMRDAKEDADAYDGAIEAHERAAERYDYAQLAAEVGIVVASIALLLSSRLVWLASVVLGLGCAGIFGWTTAQTRSAVKAADEKIHAAVENILEIESDDEVGPARGGGVPHPAEAK